MRRTPSDHAGPDASGAVGGSRPAEGPATGPGLDLLLEDVDVVADPVAETAALGPAVGVAAAGGPLVPLPSGEPVPGVGPTGESVRTGLNQAGPVAVAGLVVNGAAALLVVGVARLVSSQAYGEIAQILGLFLVLSVPGSAVLVGVVRRVTGLQAAGQGDQVRRWVARVHRLSLVAIGIELVVALAVQGWIARQLKLPDGRAIVLILVAAGVWILLSIDRGLLQAHRSYRPLAGNLLVEGVVRTVLVLGLVVAGAGVTGYALGVLLGEAAAAVHAHWLADRAWADPATAPVRREDPGAAVVLARRRLVADVSAAFTGLALLGLLQNVDVILLGRLDHANVGPYAAISVASKALVFGALALGAYLLPEATIRWNEGGHAIRQLGVTLVFLAVPAGVLLAVAVVVPRQFLTLVFSARLSGGAPAFATLVAAMLCLSVTVLLTNYLFGTGSRWIVVLLAAGSGLAVVLVTRAGGGIMATARADLLVQALLVVGMGIAFVGIHVRHRGRHWSPRRGWEKVATTVRRRG